jgi:hypothetical protein
VNGAEILICRECGAYVDDAEKHEMWHLTLTDLVNRSLPWKHKGE